MLAMERERLSKFLARSGIASRRKAEDIIRAGRVTVAGLTTLDPFYRVDPSREPVKVDGKTIKEPPRHYYIALYKPTGYLSDLADPRHRKLARELIHVEATLFPVGRLDYNSEGLILFTNDGDFANRILHPRYEVEREYRVKVSGRLTAVDMTKLIAGVRIAGETYRVKAIVPDHETASNAWYRFTVTEGKNRMIRKMADAIGHPVLKLKRTRINGIVLGAMKPGEYRFIDRDHVKSCLQDAPGTRKAL
jgi:23S rRNA pseudouridine2605 synthase